MEDIMQYEYLRGRWLVDANTIRGDHSAEFVEKEDAEAYLKFVKLHNDKLAQLIDQERVKLSLEWKERWLNHFKCPECGGKLPK